MRSGQRQQALDRIEKAVRLDGRFVETLAKLGALYAGAGQPGMAMEYLDRALSLDPNSAVTHIARAAALGMSNRWEEAEGAARRELQLDPGSVAAHYMLGAALCMQNSITPEAASHLEAAAKDFPNARAFLAEVQAVLARAKNGSN